jgi:hypothetical protein
LFRIGSAAIAGRNRRQTATGISPSHPCSVTAEAADGSRATVIGIGSAVDRRSPELGLQRPQYVRVLQRPYADDGVGATTIVAGVGATCVSGGQEELCLAQLLRQAVNLKYVNLVEDTGGHGSPVGVENPVSP